MLLMTALFRIDSTSADIARTFNARAGEDPWAGGQIAPGGFAPVVTAGRDFIAGPRPAGKQLMARIVPRVWGVPPPGPLSTEAGYGVLTVRNADSPFWIGNLRNAEFRCLVPATAFLVLGKGRDRDGRRLRHWVGCADQPLFALAAVWKDSEVPSFALLTCPPNDVLQMAGRDAMPAILPANPEARDLWLHGDWPRARQLIGPYSAAMMTVR